MRKIIKVQIEDIENGNTKVTSQDVKGLILIGKDRARILAAILPAVKALLKNDSDIRIDATFINNKCR